MSIPTLDARPDEVAVAGYAGDTLTLAIVAPWPLVQAATWTGQVRDTRDNPAVAATFTITPPGGDGQAAYATLDADTTRQLAERGTPTRLSRTSTVTRYTGVYDVQITAPGGDPVTTLLTGPLTIDLDVTRAAP